MKYQLYRLKWKLAKWFIPKYPLHVDFEISSICNLKCSFCPHSEKKQDFSKQFMDLGLYRRTIDQIAGKVPSIKLNLRGESTLHPDFDLFLKYADDKFVDVRINTNGQYKNKAIALWLTKYCKQISFSVDAFYGDTYEKIRKGGDFERLIENIDDVIKFAKNYKKKPEIVLSYVVTEENKDELKYFKRFWKARYNEIKFFVRPAMDRVHDAEVKTLGNKTEAGRKNCYMPNRRLVVASNGDVYPCCIMWHKPFIKLGNVGRIGLLDIWSDIQIKCLREELKHQPFVRKACKNCESSESYKWK